MTLSLFLSVCMCRWGKHKDLRDQLDSLHDHDPDMSAAVLRIAQELNHRIEVCSAMPTLYQLNDDTTPLQNGIEPPPKAVEVELDEEAFSMFNNSEDDEL